MVEKKQPKEKKPKAKERGIRERDGKFYYRHSIKDPVTGKRKQKETEGFFSIGEARQIGIQIQAEKLHGTYIEEQEISFVDWCDKWLVLYAAKGKVKGPTVKLREKNLKIAKRYFKGSKLREITGLMYQNMLNDMKNNGNGEKLKSYSRRSVELAHETCNMMFGKAVTLKLIKESPSAGAEVPSYQQTVEQLEAETEIPLYLEKQELALLLRTAAESDDPQGYHALYIMAYVGLRIGECCSLKISDIDQINKRISITKTLYVPTTLEDFELNTPKTPSSARKVDVSDSVLAIINKQIAWRNQFKMSVRKEFTDKRDNLNFLFVNNKKFPGLPAPVPLFEKFMKRMLIIAELPSTHSPHTLRHTYTSLMSEAGVDLIQIQHLLGHKAGSKITEAIYLHITKARKKAAVEKLDELMKGL